MTNIRFPLLITCIFTMLALNACAPMMPSGQNPWGTGTNNPTEPQDVTPAPPTGGNTALPGNKPSYSPYQNLPPVNVAILLPLSGAQANLGEAMLQGAQMALFDMGYTKFNLMPRDTGGTPNGAATAATSAINDGAQIILGPLFADSVRAIKPIARSKNINVIAFSTDWTLADNNTYLMGFMPFAQVDRVAKYAVARGHKNFALIAQQDAYGNAVSGHFTETALKNGGQISTSIRYQANDMSVVNQIENIALDAQGKPAFSAVFMPGGATQTDTVSSALSYNKMVPSEVKRLGTGLWDDPRIAAQPNMQGAWFAAPAPRVRAQFEREYSANYGAKPPRLSSLAFDATALAANLAKKGFDAGNRPAFNAGAITNPNGFAGTDGIFRFKTNGLVERGLSILELRNGSIVEVDAAPTRF